MSDKLFTVPVERLFKHILEEEKRKQILGIPLGLIYQPANDLLGHQVYKPGQYLETPLGVAAGPHTQMSQNIITAWLCGARFIELKTVQTLDELEVSKPCIDMEDEGYNCEWSQELKLLQSYHQYLDAWIILHILKHKEPQWSPSREKGFIFNLSVGYNMEGILNANVQEFLDKMGNCKEEKEAKLEKLAVLYPAVRDIHIPDTISDNITLSTMHGCPPDEIEKIGRYLMAERGYHTSIKLNPTLLGPERLREILNKKLGFQSHVPDEAFGHDLKYDDALNLIRSLQTCADKTGVQLGLKLTNTLESVNHRDIFPAKETMMYLSGRPLHPISIQVAAKLQKEFNGQLNLSFSAGADCFNFPAIIACGIRPVTVCSDILKPGGYSRLPQYLENLVADMAAQNCKSLDDYIMQRAGSNKEPREAALRNLIQYAESVVDDDRYKKKSNPGSSIKNSRPLKSFDCIQAPCQTTCPTHQDVPHYMYHTANGDYEKAFETILKTNPFPTVTGMVCDHACTQACTRVNFDNALQIRAIKRFIAENVTQEPPLLPAPPTGKRVAIIGAGPSGLSCAFYLALQGIEVNVYEARDISGGMVSGTIPGFRLTQADIAKDIQRIQNLGVKIGYNHKVDRDGFRELERSHDFIYVAVGAQSSIKLNIKGEDLEGVTDALTFLREIRSGRTQYTGQRIAVIGGGNTAVDAARTAWRLAKGEGAEVVMVYRRTRAQMPAEQEEIEAMEKEGITLMELTSPALIERKGDNLLMSCWKMELAEADSSGRPRPVRIEGADVQLKFDTIVTALGQRVELDFLKGDATPDKATLLIKGGSMKDKVYIGGDALHGGLNIITAIADGRNAAQSIINSLPGSNYNPTRREPVAAHYYQLAAHRQYGNEPGELPGSQRQNFDIVIQSMTEQVARQEAARCLLCSDFCNICVSVCPNRANFGYSIPTATFHLQKARTVNGSLFLEEAGVLNLEQPFQVLNIADFCNECGNCDTFCPTSGSPYRDKPKICLSQESFAAEVEAYFIESDQIQRKYLVNGSSQVETLTLLDDEYIYAAPDFNATLDRETLRIKTMVFNKPGVEVDTGAAVHMSIILGLGNLLP